ncbi:hypothetical protein E4U24_005915 [Claviceps purpurea]|nr:hypothetical protein E4U27_004068 [Claviceps purpurea]KAG6259314.1 hypothetical protein E4U24_005915 [Claviceps purpurea]KAG6268875.1 hypothetical protein E4U48_004517 [Claviceps purpurea]
MATPMVRSVGMSSRRRAQYGASRQDSSTSRTQKSAKAGSQRSHAGHGNHGGRNSDTSAGSSLKISNWRVRPSDDSGGISARSSFVRVDDELASSSCLSKPDLVSSLRADTAKKQPKVAKYSSASSYGAAGPADGNERIDSRVSRQGSSSSSAFSFEVLRHSSLLERDDGRSIRLFELGRSSQDSADSSSGARSRTNCTLTPVSSADFSADESFAHMISRKHTVTPDESQRDELLTALGGSEATPERSLPSFINSLQCLSLQPRKSSSMESMENFSSRDNMLRTTIGISALASPSTTYENASSTIQPASSGSCCAKGEDKELQRFHQMLENLHKNVRREPKPSKKEAGSGHKTEVAMTRGGQQQHDAGVSTAQHRRPVHSVGRRVDTESDFVVEYLPTSASHLRTESSTDFSGIGGGHDTRNSLNPKAREFLSFSKADLHAPLMPRRPLLSSYNFLPSAKDGASNLAGFAATRMAAVPDGPGILVGAGTAPALFPNYLVPPAILGHYGLESGSNPTPLNLVPVTLETPKSSDGLATPGWPTLVPMPCGSGSQPVPPRPVPKPRSPNPKTQQEYEAWVEWRKANEPGYAMACKVRQQRRAQRKTPQPTKC